MNLQDVDLNADTLVVHYAPLPITDLGAAFLLRFIAPFNMINIHKAHISHQVLFSSGETVDELLTTHCLDRWNKEVKDYLKDSKDDAKAREVIDFTKKITKVNLIECEILVPKKKETV